MDTDNLPIDSDLFSDDTSSFTARLHTTAPRTLVNNIPMEGTNFIAPFVPCTPEVALAALRFANATPLDVVGDLGCGDGRVLEQFLIHVSEKKNGNVISPRYPDANFKVIEGNMFEVGLEELGVDLFVLYLLPMGLDKLKKQLGDWLKAGVDGQKKRRVVTITYSIPGWNCDRAIEVNRQWLFYYDVSEIRE
ncbi:hypothetical protein BDR26DRAFT_867319 [Obelidium mucronatum]|nr:hypothetical protein BDR26DRAFT_867319 [Obelidium mucronatum]